MSPRCPYCQERFTPSRYHPDQVVCGKPDCSATDAPLFTARSSTMIRPIVPSAAIANNSGANIILTTCATTADHIVKAENATAQGAPA